MNKTEALKRLDALETEAAALRSIIEAPEKVEKKPLVQAKELFGYTGLHGDEGYVGSSMTSYRNGFATKSQAAAYAESFNTLLDLRRQPGSEAAEDGKEQWYMRGDGMLFSCFGLVSKLSEICPPFDTKESALAARDAVGLDRILRMCNTLHGRGV